MRGIVLGDSYMQGLFVGDDQTPTECLKRDLEKRLGAPVEILNTGHLGYSPEQYYFSLVEYAGRFPPQFVVVSIFANDFAGDLKEVLEGQGGDWDEGRYWLGRIRDFCALPRPSTLPLRPGPVGQPARRAADGRALPGRSPTSWKPPDSAYLDPINEFANALLEIEIEADPAGRAGRPATRCSMGRIGDGHFSPRGCEVWADAVGRRVALLL